MDLKYIGDETIDFKDSKRNTKLFLNTKNMSFIQLFDTYEIEKELRFFGNRWYYRTAKSADQLQNEEFKELGYNTDLGGEIFNTMVESFLETNAFYFT